MMQKLNYDYRSLKKYIKYNLTCKQSELATPIKYVNKVSFVKKTRQIYNLNIFLQ